MRIETKNLSNRTIAKVLVNKLFKIPLEIYKNLQTSLGEENVDFPCIYKKDNWITYIEDAYGNVIEEIKKSNIRKFTINNRIESNMRKIFFSTTSIQALDNFIKTKSDFFSDFIFSKKCKDIYDYIGALPLLYFIIKFENFVIKNENNVSHDIDNTFLMIIILPSGKIIDGIHGVRTICNYDEFRSSYTHSHIQGDYDFDNYIWTHFCLGADQNTVPSLIVRLKINYSPYDWLCLSNALPEMIRTESLRGHPYHYISNIGDITDCKQPVDYNTIVESNIAEQFDMFKEMICFDFTNYITKNNLLKGYGYTATSNYVYLNIHNKAQFTRDLNKLFYEYLSKELIENSLFKIILKIEKALKKLPVTRENRFCINTKFLLKLIKDNNKETLKRVLLRYFLNDSFLKEYYFSIRNISKSENVIAPKVGTPLVKFKGKTYLFIIKDYLTNRENKPKISLSVSIVKNILKYINLKLTNDMFNKENDFLII